MGDQYKQLNDRIENVENRVSNLEKAIFQTTNQKSAGVKKLSAKEFLLEKRPKDDLQRTLYLGYFLEKHNGVEAFGVEELREAFRSARMRIPSNLNDKVNKNIGKGYLMDIKSGQKGKKAWVLTATGESYVDSTTGD